MNHFAITTENAADLPDSFTKEHDVGVLSLHYMMNDVTYGEGKEEPLTTQQFYEKMRKGSLPRTQQVNPLQAMKKFRIYLEAGQDILHIALSSGVSGSCNSAKMAAKELEEEFPDRKIVVIDTLLGSLAEGRVVAEAVKLREEGKNFAETVQAIQEFLPKVRLYATVDDLQHLYRGGRLSKTAALLGGAIGIKPMFCLDNEGKLLPTAKVRGRKQSIQALFDYMEQHMGNCLDENQTVYISHGDCEDDAKMLAGMIEKKFGIHNFMINYIGPVIGSHAGPGALALSFVGDIQ